VRRAFTRVTAIPLGRWSPSASSNLPGRRDPDRIPKLTLAQKPRAVPIRSCSRWGLPCRRRCRQRGALLPHRFTLAAANTTHRGGLFSVALSLSSHPPDVIRHRLSAEPGLSSPATFRSAGAAVRPTDGTGNGHAGGNRQGSQPGVGPNDLMPARFQGASSMAVRARAAIVLGRPRAASSSCRVFRVDVSANPSTRAGRK